MRNLTEWQGSNVLRESEIRAGPLRLMADRVWNLDKYGPIQFQMTYDGDVEALMGEGSAKIFCQFVQDTLGRHE